MKPLNYLEIQDLAESFRTLVQDHLQKVEMTENSLTLGFWSEARGLRSLYIDWGRVPVALLLDRPPSVKSAKKPLGLFLGANLKGQSLAAVGIGDDGDRRLFLIFADRSEIEIRLYPTNFNILVQTPDKKISLFKPKDVVVPNAFVVEGLSRRTPEEIAHEWQGTKVPRGTVHDKNVEGFKQKLAKAIDKVTQELEQKRQTPWHLVGNWLVEHQSLAVPEEWAEYVDTKLSLAENIQICFARAKENQLKIVGTEKRLRELQQQLADGPRTKVRAVGKPDSSRADRPKARKMELSRDLVVYAGKSAVDNMRLLREAKAWYLWMHLKDHPSSHAILHRNKQQKISDEQLRRVAVWLCEVTFGDKIKKMKGEKWSLLVTECRFVRPLKGEKVGRVTYTDEKILMFQL